VQQVFLNHDSDLIDVTLAIHPSGTRTRPQQVAVRSHGSHAPPVGMETVHTTQKHPWLTTRGWLVAGQLRLGDQVQLLDGATATVVGLKVLAGAAFMYDLTVSAVHTFAVGDGQFVVHNCGQRIKTELFEHLVAMMRPTLFEKQEDLALNLGREDPMEVQNGLAFQAQPVGKGWVVVNLIHGS
jgi:hypothetical protein